MAQIYSFIRESDEDLIVISAQIGNSIVEMVLDRGASHTFIDFGILIKEGYRLSDSKGLVAVETANGVIYANKFEISGIAALGIKKQGFELTSYLFDDPQGEYRGVIGLDFLIDAEICINLKTNTLKRL